MNSYQNLIDEILIGTPREQYEQLKKMREDNINLYAKVEQAKTLCRGLLNTPSLSDIHNIVRANLETLERQD